LFLGKKGEESAWLTRVPGEGGKKSTCSRKRVSSLLPSLFEGERKKLAYRCRPRSEEGKRGKASLMEEKGDEGKRQSERTGDIFLSLLLAAGRGKK